MLSLVNSQPGIKPIPAINAIRKRIRVCFIDIFPYCFFDFYVVSSTRRSSLSNRTNVFLSAKAEIVVETRQVFLSHSARL